MTIQPTRPETLRRRFPWGWIVAPVVLGGAFAAWLVPAVWKAQDAARASVVT